MTYTPGHTECKSVVGRSSYKPYSQTHHLLHQDNPRTSWWFLVSGESWLISIEWFFELLIGNCSEILMSAHKLSMTTALSSREVGLIYWLIQQSVAQSTTVYRVTSCGNKSIDYSQCTHCEWIRIFHITLNVFIHRKVLCHCLTRTAMQH